MQTRVKRRLAVGLLAAALVVAGAVVWRGTMGTEQLDVHEPSASQLDAAAGTRLFFGHQSVGGNLLAGLADLDGFGDSGLRIVESRDAEDVTAGAVVHAALGVNGDPQSKLDAFAEVMDAGMADAVDFALLKFCYVDVDAGTDTAGLVDAYVQTVAGLQVRHPEVTFLYATVPLTTARDMKATVKSWLGRDAGMGPEDNVARQEFNAALRERFGGTGLLFDIAAVQAGGDASGAPRTHGGDDYYVLHDSFAADPGHLNEAGSRAAASELIRTIAALVQG